MSLTFEEHNGPLGLSGTHFIGFAVPFAIGEQGSMQAAMVVAPTPLVAAQYVAQLHPDLTVDAARVSPVVVAARSAIVEQPKGTLSDLLDDLIANVEGDVVARAEKRSTDTNRCIAAILARFATLQAERDSLRTLMFGHGVPL